ncbi:hypothetical protein BgAZ_209290 [Babesia gibsoni]|uniref:Alanine--tRNA ligase n=1 Tax=Babesia gibsoni TaxID=33632 RepID=A0AAD8PET1_BABGI|nr:hypothetical protein BgAZ_209290 [Babesia gibsoni]
MYARGLFFFWAFALDPLINRVLGVRPALRLSGSRSLAYIKPSFPQNKRRPLSRRITSYLRVSHPCHSARFTSERLPSDDTMGVQSKDGMLVNGFHHEAKGSNWVRDEFIRYFQSKGHLFWRSSPVLPHNDPTLLFANAGMNQFKDIIVGKADSTTEYGRLKRVCNSQKCIRAGGKHNDLDDVGMDSYHHTFFEMLGNWSFGDYFKKDAIDFAWELLTEVYKLDKERLYVTYFGGDPKVPACKPDEEARELWLRHLPAERILPFGVKDNFWEMAETGPCGPCSEIHYDHIGNRDAAKLVNMDDPTVVELWNLVFMQYDRKPSGDIELLPRPCVDTGMGLERVCAVLKKSNSNYDCDLFTDVFAYINKLMPHLPPYGGSGSMVDVSYRVIADHIRCLTVAIADGVEPSNEGRGYVLRRILRRAVRYGKEHLGSTGPFLHKLVDSVVASLGASFPEIQNQNDRISTIIHGEEVLFLETLDKGCEKFKKMVAKQKAAAKDGESLVVSGSDAFLLYSSFGFPLDLTQVMAREMGFEVDTEGFNEHSKRHQLLSEKKQIKSGNAVEQSLSDIVDSLSADVLANISEAVGKQRTDDSLKYHGFDVAYKCDTEFDVNVLALWSLHGLNKVPADGEVVAVVLNRTPFYSESGGQVWDQGLLGPLKVLKVLKMGGIVFHFCVYNDAAKDSVQPGYTVKAKVDYERRVRAACNHTATHLLNQVLRDVHDAKSEQKGSQLDDEKLKIDFVATKALSDDMLQKIQDRLQNIIDEDWKVGVKVIPFKEAAKIPGIRAGFADTYPEIVRVISIMKDGKEVDGFVNSIEVCGGTHVPSTGVIKGVVIVSEEGVSKGTRRLTCVTNAQCETAKALMETYRQKLESLIERIFKFSEGMDTYVMFQQAKENVKQLTTLRTEMEKEKYLPLLDKKHIKARFDALIGEQIDAQKVHQKKLANMAKNLANDYIKKFKDGDFEGYKTSREGVDLVSFEVSDLDGDAKALNILTQTIAKAFPDFVVLVTSSNKDGSVVSCRCVTPTGTSLNASLLANEAASKHGGSSDIARGTPTNSCWTIESQ